MTKDDERIKAIKKSSESIGYHLLHYSMLGMFIYSGLIENTRGREILVMFVIWMAIFPVVETLKPLKGVPPLSDKPWEHRSIAVISSIIAGAVATFFAWLVGVTGFTSLAGRFFLVILIVYVLFYLWFLLYGQWEKRSLER